jgi:chromosome partitioning protein
LISIAIMNAKGSVGKSTLTMALAETLSAYHGKRVLMIDADGQMSLSFMALPMAKLAHLQSQGKTIAGYLDSLLPSRKEIDWRCYIAGEASDVYDARTLCLIPGDMDLALVERDLAAGRLTGHLRERFRSLLRDAAEKFDLVLVDCSPGISAVTECWLRECNWHLIPVKPDILAVIGYQHLTNYKCRTPDIPFARHLGVVVNMKQAGAEADETIHQLLLASREAACFPVAIPMIQHIQKSALCSSEERSYHNKYPGEAGRALRAIVEDLLLRVSDTQINQDSQTLPPKLRLIA